MELNAPGLMNELICLDPLAEEHRESLRATSAVDHMWMSMPAIQRGAGFDTYFDYTLKGAKSGDALAMALLDPNDGDRFVGVTAFLDPSKLHRRVRLGYTWLAEHLRGKGVFDAGVYEGVVTLERGAGDSKKTNSWRRLIEFVEVGP